MDDVNDRFDKLLKAMVSGEPPELKIEQDEHGAKLVKRKAVEKP